MKTQINIYFITITIYNILNIANSHRSDIYNCSINIFTQYIFCSDGLMVDPYGRFNAMDAEAMIDVMSVVRLCRFVRIFALIDAVFLLIYGLQAFYFIILAVLAIAGYWGAKNLDRKYLFMYCLCLFLEIAVRCYMIYLDTTNIINIILLVLMILIDLFVARCVYKLYRAIPLLGPEQRDRILILNRVGLI